MRLFFWVVIYILVAGCVAIGLYASGKTSWILLWLLLCFWALITYLVCRESQEEVARYEYASGGIAEKFPGLPIIEKPSRIISALKWAFGSLLYILAGFVALLGAWFVLTEVGDAGGGGPAILLLGVVGIFTALLHGWGQDVFMSRWEKQNQYETKLAEQKLFLSPCGTCNRTQTEKKLSLALQWYNSLNRHQLPQCVKCYEDDRKRAEEKKRLQIQLAEEEKRRQRKLLDHWQSLSGLEFEKEVSEWFKEQGYSPTLTKASGDGGIDLFLSKGKEKIMVQCKNWKGKVGPGPVRELYGVFNDRFGQFHQAYLVISGMFTSGARKFAVDKPILLIDGSDLIKTEIIS